MARGDGVGIAQDEGEGSGEEDAVCGEGAEGAEVRELHGESVTESLRIRAYALRRPVVSSLMRMDFER
jgi:hypothetical protein